jgi:hypothetical protein
VFVLQGWSRGSQADRSIGVMFLMVTAAAAMWGVRKLFG